MFKKKLKRLKERLKAWNSKLFGLLDHYICRLRNQLHELDEMDEAVGLYEEEAYEKNVIATRHMLFLKDRKSILSRKAKINWLKVDSFIKQLSRGATIIVSRV